MASRQEEKEARRRARLEQEAADRKAAARQKRLQLLGGGVLGLGVIAAVVIVLLTGGGSSAEDGDVRAVAANLPTLPGQQETNIEAAVKAAGCELQHPADEGRGHENRAFTPADYKTNPPTSGTHFPAAAQDGIYDPGNEPELGELVHSLEHGRINVQYAPGTAKADRDRLEAFVAENGGYHMLLYQNPTKMPYKFAVTAWDQLLGCNELTDKTWDAFRTFRDRYVDKAPEKVA